MMKCSEVLTFARPIYVLHLHKLQDSRGEENQYQEEQILHVVNNNSMPKRVVMLLVVRRWLGLRTNAGLRDALRRTRGE